MFRALVGKGGGKTETLEGRCPVAQPKYIITYTTDTAERLDDDFVAIEIQAHNDSDANVILENIERFFGAVTITIEEVEVIKRKRKLVNSDRRKGAR